MSLEGVGIRHARSGWREGGRRGEEQCSRARWASVVVVLCYSSSVPSSSTYNMLATLEVSKLNAWFKLEQS